MAASTPSARLGLLPAIGCARVRGSAINDPEADYDLRDTCWYSEPRWHLFVSFISYLAPVS